MGEASTSRQGPWGPPCQPGQAPPAPWVLSPPAPAPAPRGHYRLVSLKVSLPHPQPQFLTLTSIFPPFLKFCYFYNLHKWNHMVCNLWGLACFHLV